MIRTQIANTLCCHMKNRCPLTTSSTSSKENATHPMRIISHYKTTACTPSFQHSKMTLMRRYHGVARHLAKSRMLSIFGWATTRALHHCTKTHTKIAMQLYVVKRLLCCYHLQNTIVSMVTEKKKQL